MKEGEKGRKERRKEGRRERNEGRRERKEGTRERNEGRRRRKEIKAERKKHTVLKTQHFTQVYLPTIKADCVVLYEMAHNQKLTVKKWKQIQEKYFVVEPVQRQELLPMHQALQRDIRQRMDAALALEEAKYILWSTALTLLAVFSYFLFYICFEA